jgi:dienelactone hydrolase
MKRLPVVVTASFALFACARPQHGPENPQALPPGADLVTFPARDGVTLSGFLYLPHGDGPFPAVLWNHGSEKLPGWQLELAAFYTTSGFAFFIPHRRGQGKSRDRGEYILDRQPSILRFVFDRTNAERTVIALHEEASADVEAALEWLKHRPEIDPTKIVMSGVSFGGIQTLLAAEKRQGVRAFAAFAPGAMSWQHVSALGVRLEAAIEAADVPILIVQAKNDFDLAPSEALGPVLERKKLGRAIVFPAFGTTAQDGHGRFACSTEGTRVWGSTVIDHFNAALALHE